MIHNNLNKLLIALALLALVALGGCVTAMPAQVTTGASDPQIEIVTKAELEEELKTAIYAYEDAFEAGDVDTLMMLYADDVVSLAPGLPTVEGKEALEAELRGFFDAYSLDREFELVDFQVEADTASRLMEWTNTWTPKGEGEVMTEVGRCVFDFERVDGEWKVTREIWNTYEVDAGEAAEGEAATEAELQEELKAAIYAYEDAFEAGDVDTLMTLYADDVVSLAPGLPKVEGKEALEAELRGFFDVYSLDRDFELVDMEVEADTASRLMEWTNTWTPKDGGEVMTEVGRCIFDFEKIDGEWKVTREIWNTY